MFSITRSEFNLDLPTPVNMFEAQRIYNTLSVDAKTFLSSHCFATDFTPLKMFNFASGIYGEPKTPAEQDEYSTYLLDLMQTEQLDMRHNPSFAAYLTELEDYISYRYKGAQVTPPFDQTILSLREHWTSAAITDAQRKAGEDTLAGMHTIRDITRAIELASVVVTLVHPVGGAIVAGIQAGYASYRGETDKALFIAGLNIITHGIFGGGIGSDLAALDGIGSGAYNGAADALWRTSWTRAAPGRVQDFLLSAADRFQGSFDDVAELVPRTVIVPDSVPRIDDTLAGWAEINGGHSPQIQDSIKEGIHAAYPDYLIGVRDIPPGSTSLHGGYPSKPEGAVTLLERQPDDGWRLIFKTDPKIVGMRPQEIYPAVKQATDAGPEALQTLIESLRTRFPDRVQEIVSDLDVQFVIRNGKLVNQDDWLDMIKASVNGAYENTTGQSVTKLINHGDIFSGIKNRIKGAMQKDYFSYPTYLYDRNGIKTIGTGWDLLRSNLSADAFNDFLNELARVGYQFKPPVQ